MTRRIRKAQPSDTAALLDLIRQHAAFEQAVAAVTQGDLSRLLERREPPVHLIVAEESGVLLGYAALTFDYALWSASHFAHLDCLFVAADARGRGLGKMLFDEACRLAEAAGAPRMEWQTPAWNADAIRFYEREGGMGRAKMRFSKACPARLPGPPA